MCALLLGGTRSSQIAGHMEDEVWDRVIEAAPHLGHVNVNGWGENFSHPRFLAFLNDLDQHGVSTNFSTNGTYLTPSAVKSLASLRHLQRINVSIDSPDPEIFREIRGRSLKPVLRGLRSLMGGFPRPERVTVSSVVMRSNAESLRDFPSLLAELGVGGYVLQGLVDADDQLSQEHVGSGAEPNEADIRSAVDAVVEACHSHELPVLVHPYLGYQLGRQEPTVPAQSQESIRQAHRSALAVVPSTRQCVAPWEHIFINKDGLVLPCCNCSPWEQKLGNDDSVMGDLGQESFAEIWHGERFRKFRDGLLNGRLPAICRGCTVTTFGPHVFKLYSARIVEDSSGCEGDQVYLVIENTGAVEWTRETYLRLGTSNPRDRDSSLWHPTWLSAQRVAGIEEDVVPPGERATLRFRLGEAKHRGGRPERFQLLAENLCWLLNTEIELTCEASRWPLMRFLGGPRARMNRPIAEAPEPSGT